MLIENYSGRALSQVLLRAREVLAASWSSWSFVRKSPNPAKLQSLAFPVDCPGADSSYQSYRQGQNGRRIVRRKRAVRYAKPKNLLIHELCLNSKETQSHLNSSKDTDVLRDSQSLGECTSNSCVSQEREDNLFDPEMDEIIRNLDLNDVVNRSSAQGSNNDRLFSQEFEDLNSPLSDIFNSISSQKDSIAYDTSQNFDFTARVLRAARLKDWVLIKRISI